MPYPIPHLRAQAEEAAGYLSTSPYLIFTVGLGIGDTDIFDWGGVLSALIGTVIVLLIFTFVMRRRARTLS